MFNNLDERLYFEDEMLPRIYGKKSGLFRIHSRHCINFFEVSKTLQGITVSHLLEDMKKGAKRKFHPFAFIQAVQSLCSEDEFFQCESISVDEVLTLKEDVNYMKANQGEPLINILQFKPHWRELLFFSKIVQTVSEFSPEISARPLPSHFPLQNNETQENHISAPEYEEAIRLIEIEMAKEQYSQGQRQDLLALKYSYEGMTNKDIYQKVTEKTGKPEAMKTLGSKLVSEGKNDPIPGKYAIEKLVFLS